MPSWDFVVVGGGPAGLAVAMEAVRAGASALVVERGRGAVDKACGEGLMPAGVAALQRLGVAPPAWGTHPFRGIRYIDGEVVAEAHFVDGTGLGVRRLALSEAMEARADALGVERWAGTEALGWRETASGVELDTSRGIVSGRWLVGADGLHSRVRREAGFGVTTGPGRRLGIRRHFAVRPWADVVEVWWGDGVEAYVTPVGPEQVGVAFLWSGGKGDYETFLGRFPALAARLGPVDSALRGAGPFDVRVATRHRGRVLLAGDAGGYVDAITGEGISLALHAAPALVAAALAGRPEAWTTAADALHARHVRFTRLLLTTTRRPWLRRRIIRALRRFPAGFEAFLAYNSGAWPAWRALPGMSTVGVGLLTG